ncbi:hypothetical protein [Mandarin fish ranavirus]|nr:hypothetical protein [Mandarin fish ranavirus]
MRLLDILAAKECHQSVKPFDRIGQMCYNRINSIIGDIHFIMMRFLNYFFQIGLNVFNCVRYLY